MILLCCLINYLLKHYLPLLQSLDNRVMSTLQLINLYRFLLKDFFYLLLFLLNLPDTPLKSFCLLFKQHKLFHRNLHHFLLFLLLDIWLIDFFFNLFSLLSLLLLWIFILFLIILYLSLSILLLGFWSSLFIFFLFFYFFF